MKAKFAKNDAVKTTTATGTIKEIAEFKDHVEYLVALKDQTASWHHENNLKPAAANSQLPTPNS